MNTLIILDDFILAFIVEIANTMIGFLCENCYIEFPDVVETKYDDMTPHLLRQVITRLEKEESFAIVMRNALSEEECNAALEIAMDTPQEQWTQIYRSGYEMKDHPSTGLARLLFFLFGVCKYFPTSHTNTRTHTHFESYLGFSEAFSALCLQTCAQN